MTNKGYLFDASPIEDEDGPKKKKTRRKAAAQVSPVVVVREADEEFTPGYMASIEGHFRCEHCDLSVVDLVDIKRVGKKEEWLIKCGWWCQTEWWVDAIPGLLDKQPDEKKEFFRVIGGRFDGKTFDEIDAMGCRWYMQDIVKVGTRKILVEAAARWLLENA